MTHPLRWTAAVSVACVSMLLLPAAVPQTPTVAAVRLPPVFLNHFFAVIDHETYTAIDQSTFLHDRFAPFERRTTVRTDRSYTGIYFYGTNTYFEFFDATTQTDPRRGTEGLAFSPEQPGTVLRLRGSIGGEPPALITRKLGDAQLPWFWQFNPPGLPSGGALDTWVMEYHPDFLEQWHPELTRGEHGTARRPVLQRYRAVLTGIPSAPLLEDVREVTIALDEPTRDRMVAWGRQLGYAAHPAGEDVRLDGPDVVLRLVPASGRYRGIVRVLFAVRDAPAQREMRFGSSTLRFDGQGQAAWEFKR